MELKLLNGKDQAAGKVEASDTIFGREYNEALIHQIVVAFQANARTADRQQKSRETVAHTTKKPWRQKGTGRARVGTKRNPVWTGGGAAFGPHMREYGFKMPKKMRRAALRSELSEKFAQGELIVFDEFAMDAPKTKVMADLFKKFEAENA